MLSLAYLSAMQAGHQERPSAPRERRFWLRRHSSRRCHHPNENRPATMIVVKAASSRPTPDKAYVTSRMRPAYGSADQHIKAGRRPALERTSAAAKANTARSSDGVDPQPILQYSALDRSEELRPLIEAIDVHGA